MTLLCRLLILYCAAGLLVSLPAAAEDSVSFNQKGMVELNSNHPDRAADYFLQAISLDSDKRHYYNNLAVAYMRLGEYAKAEEQLKISISLDENYVRALSNMTVTLFHLGRYRDSYRYYILSKSADSEYAAKRFDKKRVFSFVKKLSDDKPEDEYLKRIKEFMEKTSLSP